MFEGLQKFIAIKAVRWVATLVAGSVVGAIFANSTIIGYVHQACAALSSPEKLEAGIVSGSVAIATLFFSVKDVVTVSAKQTTAAITGSVAAANDPKIRADVVAAVKTGVLSPPTAPPESLDDLIAARQAAARGG